MIEEHVIDLEITPAVFETNQTTTKLTRIWKQVLGLDSISPYDNYFDLGGDSILAVQLFAQIERAFGTKLPVATLFEAPTIADMARVLRREVAVSRWSPLVPIQSSGSRPPFFCIHGAGGNVLIYRDLSQELGSDQPFYGLQAQGLDGSCTPLKSVEEMAALYAAEIRNVSPSGPYFLGGYCGGGTIAYEVAQQLRRSGEEVALLAMFDSMNWSHFAPKPSLGTKLYYRCQKFFFHLANFSLLDSKGKRKFASEKFRILRSRVPVWRGMLMSKLGIKGTANDVQSRVLGEIWRNNDQAFCDYVPEPYHGRVTDFRPLKQYRAFSSPNAKWDKLAQGGQEIVNLPVYPAGMLVEPLVKHLAAALRGAIDRAMQSAVR